MVNQTVKQFLEGIKAGEEVEVCSQIGNQFIVNAYDGQPIGNVIRYTDSIYSVDSVLVAPDSVVSLWDDAQWLEVLDAFDEAVYPKDPTKAPHLIDQRIAYTILGGVLYVVKANPFYLKKDSCVLEFTALNTNKCKIPVSDRNAVIFGSNKNIDILIDTRSTGVYSEVPFTKEILAEKFSEQDVDDFIRNFKFLMDVVGTEGIEQNNATTEHKKECTQLYNDFLAICRAFDIAVGAADFNLAGIGMACVTFVKFPTPVSEGMWQLTSNNGYEKYGMYTPGMTIKNPK